LGRGPGGEGWPKAAFQVVVDVRRAASTNGEMIEKVQARKE